MFVYDRAELLQRLTSLSRMKRAAFAAACAERLFPLYEVFNRTTGQGQPQELRKALDLLWKCLKRDTSERDCETLRKYADICESLSPEEDSRWTPLTPYAQDAAASAANAIGCLLTGKPEMAVGAAYCGYEAADYYVHNKEKLEFAEDGTEEKILESPEVQQVFAAQATDLDHLSKWPDAELNMAIEELRRRASEAKPLVAS